MSVLEEVEEVARKQVSEDIQLYGTRPEPPDAVDIDEVPQLADPPPKRNLSESQAAIDRPAKARKKGYNKAYNYETVAALDWNRGASPLEAWLNQSAVPSTILAAEAQNQGPKDTKISLMAEEVKELKNFRNVHIATTPEPEQSELAVPTVNEMGDLELGARIYYRNITDRYPLLPTYLAHRLAKANHCRAERLRHKQDGDEATRGSMNISPTRSHTSTILRGGGNQPGPVSKDVIGRLNETKTTHAQKKYQCKICDKYFTRPSSLRIHTYSHTGEKRTQESSH